MIIAIAMSVSDHTAFTECYLLYVLAALYIICMYIKNSLFLIGRSQGSLIVSFPLVLNPIYLGLQTITLQYRDLQSALDVFQKYRSCQDYTNLFWHKCFSYNF